MKDQYTLSPSSIDELSRDFEEFLKASKYKKENITITKLEMEWMLLEWLKNHEGETLYVETKTVFNKPYLYFKLKGPMDKPISEDDSYATMVTGNLKTQAGMTPVYSYKNETNILKFSPKRSDIYRIILAVFLGIIFSILLSFISPNTSNYINKSFIDPILNIILGVIKMVGIPMVFISLITGIVSSGSISKVGQIGKSLVGNAFLLQAFSAVISLVLSLLLYHPHIATQAQNSSDISEVFGFLYNLIPVNIIDPFLTGNCIQLLIMALGVGIALLIMNQKGQAITTLMNQIFEMWMIFLEWVSKLIPILVFFVVSNIIISGNASYLLDTWPVLVITLISSVIVVALCLIHLNLSGLSPTETFKAILPIWLTGTITCSSAITYGTIYKILTEKLNIESSFVSFGAPFVNTLTKIMFCPLFISIPFYFAITEGIEISVSWIILCTIIAFVLSSAVPPVAGGATASYTLILTQLGIPIKYLAIAIILNVVLEFFITGVMQIIVSLIVIRAAKVKGYMKNPQAIN